MSSVCVCSVWSFLNKEVEVSSSQLNLIIRGLEIELAKIKIQPLFVYQQVIRLAGVKVKKAENMGRYYSVKKLGLEENECYNIS